MTPWKTLELDPKTATERDVKRAYAKKLKVTRPDKDPEGFQELRDAYQWALNELRWAQEEDDFEEEEVASAADSTSSTDERLADPDVEDDPLQATPIARASGGLGTFDSELKALQDALKKEEGVAEAVRAYEGALFSNPEHVQAWGGEFAELLRQHPDCEDLRLRSEAILFELEHDGMLATQAIIERASEEMDEGRIGNLATLFRKNSSRISSNAGAQAICQLATAAALWSPLHIKPLLDKAYEVLPITWRDHAIASIERDAILGSLLNALPRDQRKFWAERLQNPYHDWDWKSEESLKAIDYVVKNVSRSWKGMHLVLEAVPEQHAQRIRMRMPKEQRVASGGGDSGPNGWVIAVIVFIIIKVSVAASQCSDSTGYRDTPSFEDNIISLDEIQRLRDEGKLIQLNPGELTPEEIQERLSQLHVDPESPEETGDFDLKKVFEEGMNPPEGAPKPPGR